MRKYIILVLIALLIGALFVGVLAAGPSKPAGKSNVAHLYLYEKTPAELTNPPTPWEIVEGGAWGKMKYNTSGSTFDFVFNGHGLIPGYEYTLIYYPDHAWPDNPWPREGIICLGNGIVNDEGNIHIAESVDTGDLPTAEDAALLGGAKIWLVLSADVECDVEMFGWNPTEYLFEEEAINFDDTDE